MFQVCLLSGQIAPLLTLLSDNQGENSLEGNNFMKNIFPVDQTTCYLTLFLLHFLPLASLTFLLLESIIIFTTMRPVSCHLTSSCPLLLLTGLLPSSLYSVLLVSTGQWSQCWPSPSSAQYSAPLVTLASVSLITLIISCWSTRDPSAGGVITRADTLAITRVSVMLIMVGVSSVSVLAPLSQSSSEYQAWITVSYHVARLLLTACVIFRTLADKQVN